jgi:hypothetical protein
MKAALVKLGPPYEFRGNESAETIERAVTDYLSPFQNEIMKRPFPEDRNPVPQELRFERADETSSYDFYIIKSEREGAARRPSTKGHEFYASSAGNTELNANLRTLAQERRTSIRVIIENDGLQCVIFTE